MSQTVKNAKVDEIKAHFMSLKKIKRVRNIFKNNVNLCTVCWLRLTTFVLNLAVRVQMRYMHLDYLSCGLLLHDTVNLIIY